jgi:hypothetical protein
MVNAYTHQIAVDFLQSIADQFLGSSQNCEKLRHDFLSVYPSVRTKQPGSQWTDFHEI